MNNIPNKRRFNYVLTLDERIDPRYLVKHMARHGYYNAHLVSVTDLQSNRGVAGYTYRRKPTRTGTYMANKRSFWRDIAYELIREVKRFV